MAWKASVKPIRIYLRRPDTEVIGSNLTVFFIFQDGDNVFEKLDYFFQLPAPAILKI
jgi:hypothetical protein